MTEADLAPTHPAIHADEWPAIELPPTNLPYDDREPMASPWHRDAINPSQAETSNP